MSRQVVALEADLGVALFERVGRKLVLTETGTDLLAHIKVMGEAADTVALAASGRGEQITGRVSISATDTYAAYILPQIVERIRQEAPQLTIAIIASNELSNLHRREADIAIRHLGPDRPGLVGQHLRDTQADFYASEEWVARNGLPETPGDLAGADLIGFDDAAQYAGYLQEIGFPVREGDFRLQSSSSVAIWEMVRRGMGVAPMLREIASRTAGVVRLAAGRPADPGADLARHPSGIASRAAHPACARHTGRGTAPALEAAAPCWGRNRAVAESAVDLPPGLPA